MRDAKRQDIASERDERLSRLQQVSSIPTLSQDKQIPGIDIRVGALDVSKLQKDPPGAAENAQEVPKNPPALEASSMMGPSLPIEVGVERARDQIQEDRQKQQLRDEALKYIAQNGKYPEALSMENDGKIAFLRVDR